MLKYLVLLLFSVVTKAQIDSKGHCGTYHGKICMKYFNSSEMVWFSADAPWRNEEITTGLWSELIVGLKEPCRSAAEVYCSQ